MAVAHMHEIGGKAGAARGTSYPDHTGRTSFASLWLCTTTTPTVLPLAASELLADQRCLTQKSERKKKECTELRDGTRLIHDAILVSGVLSATQSYSHTLPHHPGGLLSAFMVTHRLPSNLLFLFQFLRQTCEYPPNYRAINCRPKSQRIMAVMKQRRASPYNVAVALQGTSPMSAVDSHTNAGYHGS